MLPRQNRLPVQNLLALKKTARRGQSKFFGVLYQENNLPQNRFAITISTKVSKKAVERNRIKRIVRHEIMDSYTKMDKSCDILILAKVSVAGKESGEIVSDLTKLFAEINF